MTFACPRLPSFAGHHHGALYPNDAHRKPGPDAGSRRSTEKGRNAAPSRQRLSAELLALGVAEELLAAAAALDADYQHGAHVASVELVLDRLRILERVDIPGLEHLVEAPERGLCLLVEAEHAGEVLGLALQELLAIGQVRL